MKTIRTKAALGAHSVRRSSRASFFVVVAATLAFSSAAGCDGDEDEPNGEAGAPSSGGTAGKGGSSGKGGGAGKGGGGGTFDAGGAAGSAGLTGATSGR